MITSYTDIAVHYIILLAVFVLILLFGHIAWSLFIPKNESNKLFQKLCIGLVGAPTIYAIVRTSGATVLCGNILVLIIYFISYRPKLRISNFSINLKEILPYLAFLSLAYLVMTFSFWDYTDEASRVLTGDYAFYSKIASYLRELGIENIYLEYYLPEIRGLSPYHYTEIWFAAFVSGFFSVHSQLAYGLIFFPIIYTGIYSGVIQLIERLSASHSLSSSWIKYLVAISFFFTAAFGELYPNDIEFLKQDLWSLSLLRRPQSSYVYLLLIWAAFQLLDQKYFAFMLNTALLGLGYLNIAPALFLGVGIWVLYLSWQERNIKLTIKLLSPLIAITIFVAVFYIVGSSGKSANPITSGSGESILIHYDSVSKIKTIMNIYLKTIIQIVLTGLPYLIVISIGLIVIPFKQKELVIIPIIVFTSLGVWSVLYWMHDSVQLWANLHTALVNILYFSVCILMLKSVSNWIKFISIALLMLNILSNTQDLRRDSMIIESHTALITVDHSAYYRTNANYNSVFSKMEQVWQGYMPSLALSSDYIPITCLSVHQIPATNSSEEAMKRSTTFYLYHQLINIKEKLSIEETQQRFIEEHDIKYLFVDSKELPSQFSDQFNGKPITKIDSYFVYQRK